MIIGGAADIPTEVVERRQSQNPDARSARRRDGAIELGPPEARADVTPIVLFPAYHLTKLKIDVYNQTVAPNCPASGTFEYWFMNPNQSPFSQTCQDQLLTLRHAKESDAPMADRVSDQRGVTVVVPDYGRTESAPFYEPMYQRLEAAGYVRNRSIRVAARTRDSRPTSETFWSVPRT